MAIYVAFLGAKLVILDPTDFLFGLPINLIVNTRQNKFEVDILKNVAKITNLRPKIGHIPLLSLDIIGITRSFFIRFWLTLFKIACFHKTNRMVSKSKLYRFWLIFWCWPHFCSEASHG